jgi:hypothetical protein
MCEKRRDRPERYAWARGQEATCLVGSRCDKRAQRKTGNAHWNTREGRLRTTGTSSRLRTRLLQTQSCRRSLAAHSGMETIPTPLGQPRPTTAGGAEPRSTLVTEISPRGTDQTLIYPVRAGHRLAARLLSCAIIRAGFPRARPGYKVSVAPGLGRAQKW